MLQTVLNAIDQLPGWVHALTSIVSAATVVTTMTPNRHDDAVVDVLLRVLNALAGNIGRNRNADDA